MKLLFITLTVLQSLLATLEQKTLVSDFTLTYNQSPIANSPSPITYTGNLAMHGKQFSLSMFSMDAAYDGNTLYIYIVRNWKNSPYPLLLKRNWYKPILSSMRKPFCPYANMRRKLWATRHKSHLPPLLLSPIAHRQSPNSYCE